eukprot:TRINITY_DN1383_c1_g1_i1.p3 TRINITY_DN1383_c1_g1~~TRINITY_DN1383_c1_g1_i1.p3  ORF type:complete len:218 (+),score=-14.30 TRINITY_DN1383_c1_g1_i1:66-719(+)
MEIIMSTDQFIKQSPLTYTNPTTLNCSQIHKYKSPPLQFKRNNIDQSPLVQFFLFFFIYIFNFFFLYNILQYYNIGKIYNECKNAYKFICNTQETQKTIFFIFLILCYKNYHKKKRIQQHTILNKNRLKIVILICKQLIINKIQKYREKNNIAISFQHNVITLSQIIQQYQNIIKQDMLIFKQVSKPFKTNKKQVSEINEQYLKNSTLVTQFKFMNN